MAANARLRGRNTSKGGSLDRRVAVAAVDAIVADVMLVAEGYRLARSHIYIRDERSCVDLISGQYHDGDHQQHSNDADFRQTVRTAMKDLRHVQHTATIGTDRPPAFLNRARIAPCQ